MRKEEEGGFCTHQGYNIKYWREFKKWNQERLGEKMSITQPQVSHYEKMETLEEEVLNRFARALGVPVQKLIGCNHTEETDKAFTVINNFHKEVSTGYQHIQQQHNSPMEKVSELYERIIELTRQIEELKKENELLKRIP